MPVVTHQPKLVRWFRVECRLGLSEDRPWVIQTKVEMEDGLTTDMESAMPRMLVRRSVEAVRARVVGLRRYRVS